MDGKRDEAGRGAAKRKAAAVQQAEFTDRLKTLLFASANTLDDLDKAAKTIGIAARSGQWVRELEAYDTPSGGDDEPMDFAAEDRLRADILRGVAAVAARLEQAGIAPCPGCGRFDLDPERLEQLGRRGADAAREPDAGE